MTGSQPNGRDGMAATRIASHAERSNRLGKQSSTNSRAKVWCRWRGEHGDDRRSPRRRFRRTRQPLERPANARDRVVDDVTRNPSPFDSSLHSLGERQTHVVCQRHYHLVN